MIDSHVHLDAEQYPDPSGPIKRALYEGVTAMIVPGTGPASNRKVLELARKYPGVVHPAFGFHPERFDQTERDADEVLDMIVRERNSISAIGEVGLPWYGARAADAQRAYALTRTDNALVAAEQQPAARLNLTLHL